MRWLTHHRRAVAQDGGFWPGEPPLAARALRKHLIRQGHALHLRSPFCWRDYLGALLHSVVPTDTSHYVFDGNDADSEPPLRIVSTVFGPGESARWVMRRPPDHTLARMQRTHPSPLLANGVRYTLLLSELADDEYLEHIVYHELGHLQRGHLAQALALGSETWLCAGAPGGASAELNLAQRWEQEAELFAVTLTRLARGWDPALAPSTMSRFFDLLM